MLFPAVKCWVGRIEVLSIQMVLDNPEPFTKPLEMHNLTRTQEPDRICNFLVLYQTQDIVIGAAGFLFRCQILRQVGNRVALGLEFAGIEGDSPCGLRPQRQGMVHIIFIKARCLNLLWGQVFR